MRPQDPPHHSFKYPWKGLEETLSKRRSSHLRVLAYGSLMNVKSAALTMPGECVDKRRAVLATGIRRVFTYAMSKGGGRRYGPPPGPSERAALNVESTGNPSDKVNGVIVEVRLEEIEPFRQREREYDLIEIPVTDFYSGDLIQGPVYVLSLPHGEDDLLPHPVYLDVCREGARSVSAAFEHVFLTTTFLSDRVTSVKSWIEDLS